VILILFASSIWEHRKGCKIALQIPKAPDPSEFRRSWMKGRDLTEAENKIVMYSTPPPWTRENSIVPHQTYY